MSVAIMSRETERAYLKLPKHDLKKCPYFEAKNWHQNFDGIFDSVWEIFFVKKYIDSKYWRIKSAWYILMSRQYFDNSSIFWRVCGPLSKFWSKIQSPGKHLAKTRATAKAACGTNIFNTMNFDQNFDGTCVGSISSKILSKIGRPFFYFKILTFLIVYGAL